MQLRSCAGLMRSCAGWFVFASIFIAVEIRMKVSIYAIAKKSYTTKEEPTTREILDYLPAYSNMSLIYKQLFIKCKMDPDWWVLIGMSLNEDIVLEIQLNY
ncbi:unnamed protein product, partial [Urochloa humidicola]